MENMHFDVDMKALIIETLLLFALIQESLMELSGLREKPNGYDHYVTFASRAKLWRFVCTLAAQLLSLRSGNSNLGFDRIGSHTGENYISNIRSICHGDNRSVTGTRQISRFELARRLLSELSIDRHITKRVNLGGVSVTAKSDLQFSLDGSPADFAIELLLTAGIPLHEISRLNQARIYPLNPDSHMPKFYLGKRYTLMQQAPLPENMVRVRTSIHGYQIVSRLHGSRNVKDEVDESGGEDQEVKPLTSDSTGLL
jgi:hypothetical protein